MNDSSDESNRSRKAGIAATALTKGLISAIPGFGGTAVELFNGWEEVKRRRQASALQAAIAETRIDVQELKSKLDNDEDLAALWERALNAAQSAKAERHRYLYVAIMAGAVYSSDSDRLQAKVLLRLLEQLEEEHLRLIAVIDEEAREDGAPSERRFAWACWRHARGPRGPTSRHRAGSQCNAVDPARR